MPPPPPLRLKAGQWQRWRLVHTGYKRFLDLQILDGGGEPAAGCELGLVAKDGVYVPQARGGSGANSSPGMPAGQP